ATTAKIVHNNHARRRQRARATASNADVGMRCAAAMPPSFVCCARTTMGKSAAGAAFAAEQQRVERSRSRGVERDSGASRRS
ncbi:hypothetical protein Dimus_004194, partial [Dionaea muscipula]